MRTRYGHNGVHLFDRRAGANILLDEVEVSPAIWSRAPRYMSMALTNACELECAYCYAPKNPARLTFDEVIRWTSDLDTAGCFGIGFGGGEPTLFPRFGELCQTIHQNTGLAVTMTTHGHRFSESLSAELAGSVDFIRLSMDGVGEVYERLRGRPFEVFHEKLRLVRTTAPFGINYVVNRDTISQLSQAADFAFENGASEFLLLPEMKADGLSSLTVDEQETLSDWTKQNYRHFRLATSSQGQRLIDAPILLEGAEEFATFDFMHLDASAMLKTCAFTENGVPVRQYSSLMDAVEHVRSSLTTHGDYNENLERLR